MPAEHSDHAEIRRANRSRQTTPKGSGWFWGMENEPNFQMTFFRISDEMGDPVPPCSSLLVAFFRFGQPIPVPPTQATEGEGDASTRKPEPGFKVGRKLAFIEGSRNERAKK